MNYQVVLGILIPLIGTTAGSGLVYFLKDDLSQKANRSLSGFAAGVMFAASIWSLLIPAFEHASQLGVWSFVPGVIGFWLGILLLLVIDNLIPHFHVATEEVEGPSSSLRRTTKMVLAIVIHNIPEGMAVGVLFGAYLAGDSSISLASAIILSIGIAIQNFPEGTIVSMPLRAEGFSKHKAFLVGAGSGVVEPIAAVITIFLAQIMVPLLPYALGLAAGAMIYVVVEELIPAMAEGEHSHVGTLFFSLGFTVMMVLDVALG